MSDISLAFMELFYGSGSWLGLLLLLSIVLILSMRIKYAGLLMLPVTIFLGIDYLSYPTLIWNSLIMFLSSIFILISLTKDKF